MEKYKIMITAPNQNNYRVYLPYTFKTMQDAHQELERLEKGNPKCVKLEIVTIK